MAEEIFYKMPFNVGTLLEGKGRLAKTDLPTSVRQNLRLLLTTPPMRVEFAPIYGCKIHWSQFLTSNRMMDEEVRLEDSFKVKMEQNISALIGRYEQRINLKEVNIDLRYAKDDHQEWLPPIGRKTKGNVIQIVVKIKASIKPEFAFDGDTLDLEDTISLF
jgi:Phage baseplate assembly protein W